MSIWKRAALYITRKKIRSILLFAILLVMGLFLLVGLSVRSSAEKAAADIRKTLPAGLSLTPNIPANVTAYEVTYDENGEAVYRTTVPILFESDWDDILAIDGVLGCHARMERDSVYTGLEVHPGHNINALAVLNGTAPEREEGERESLEPLRDSIEAYARSNSFAFTYDTEYYPAFVNGALELTQGRHLKKGDVKKAVISEELAETNGLQIGDGLEAYKYDFITGERFGEGCVTEIVGIYRINFEETISYWTYEPDILANVIFVDPEVEYLLSRDYLIHYNYQVRARVEDEALPTLTIYVEDPAMLDSVKEQLMQMDSVNWDYYNIETDSQDYQNAAGSLLTMVKLSNVLIVIMAVGSLMILSLILSMWMRSRKYEICVLASIGVKKNAIRMQFLFECCIITAAAFLAAALLAGSVTDFLGNGLLSLLNPSGQASAYEVTLAQETSDMYVNMAPVRQEALQYNIPPSTAVFVFLAMLAVSVWSVLFSSRHMLNQKPREMYFDRPGPERKQAEAFTSVTAVPAADEKERGQTFYTIPPIPDHRSKDTLGQMTTIRRAILYVSRKTGKTALLLTAFVIIMTLVLTGIAVHHSSEKTAATLLETFRGYFKVETNRQTTASLQYMDQSLVDRIMGLDGIQSCNAMDTSYLMVSDLVLEPGRFAAEGDSKAQMTSFLGNMDSSLHEYFTRNILTLTDGRHLQPDDRQKALISKKLSETNQLYIGDTFFASITEDTAPGSSAAGRDFPFEVVGIFGETQESFVSMNIAECDIAANYIFIDSASSQEIRQALNETEESIYTGGASFWVTDPRRMEEIVGQVENLDGVNWDSFEITVHNEDYERTAEPIDRLSGTMFLMVGLIVAIGAILLTLLLSLWERDRIHEAGVLMSFGISKWNILLQHFLESASIFLAAFLLAVVISLPISGRIGQMLYNSEVTRAEQTAETSEYSFSDPSDVEVSFEAALQPISVVISGILGLLLVSVSSGAAFVVIARRNPKNLLTIME